MAGLFTQSPNERVTTRTIAALSDMVKVLPQAWTSLTQNGARLLTAQHMVETGSQNCWNWNLGNIKAPTADVPHMYLMGVWECIKSVNAASEVQKGHAHLATEQEKARHSWWRCAADSTLVVYEPPHSMCRFRAYASLTEGIPGWLSHHQRYANIYADYLKAINAGDTAEVAHYMKLQGYYTAKEEDYASGMAAQKKAIDQILGPIT